MLQVRCNGSHPCRNCIHAALSCTFNKPPQKKGPKGSRAKVISELRETQKLTSATMGARPCFEAPSASPIPARNHELLTPDLIDSCTSIYFTNLYPTIPIIYDAQVQQHRAELHSSSEAYCLIAAFCAFVLIQPGIPLKEGEDNKTVPVVAQDTIQGSLLVEEVVRVRMIYDHVDNPTISTVITAFFLSACYFGLERHNCAWFYLREAITLAQILGMQDESTYLPGNVDNAVRRQLFWLLFVSERCAYF